MRRSPCPWKCISGSGGLQRCKSGAQGDRGPDTDIKVLAYSPQCILGSTGEGVWDTHGRLRFRSKGASTNSYMTERWHPGGCGGGADSGATGDRGRGRPLHQSPFQLQPSGSCPFTSPNEGPEKSSQPKCFIKRFLTDFPLCFHASHLGRCQLAGL